MSGLKLCILFTLVLVITPSQQFVDEYDDKQSIDHLVQLQKKTNLPKIVSEDDDLTQQQEQFQQKPSPVNLDSVNNQARPTPLNLDDLNKLHLPQHANDFKGNLMNTVITDNEQKEITANTEITSDQQQQQQQGSVQQTSDDHYQHQDSTGAVSNGVDQSYNQQKTQDQDEDEIVIDILGKHSQHIPSFHDDEPSRTTATTDDEEEVLQAQQLSESSYQQQQDINHQKHMIKKPKQTTKTGENRQYLSQEIQPCCISCERKCQIDNVDNGNNLVEEDDRYEGQIEHQTDTDAIKEDMMTGNNNNDDEIRDNLPQAQVQDMESTSPISYTNSDKKMQGTSPEVLEIDVHPKSSQLHQHSMLNVEDRVERPPSMDSSEDAEILKQDAEKAMLQSEDRDIKGQEEHDREDETNEITESNFSVDNNNNQLHGDTEMGKTAVEILQQQTKQDENHIDSSDEQNEQFTNDDKAEQNDMVGEHHTTTDELNGNDMPSTLKVGMGEISKKNSTTTQTSKDEKEEDDDDDGDEDDDEDNDLETINTQNIKDHKQKSINKNEKDEKNDEKNDVDTSEKSMKNESESLKTHESKNTNTSEATDGQIKNNIDDDDDDDDDEDDESDTVAMTTHQNNNNTIENIMDEMHKATEKALDEEMSKNNTITDINSNDFHDNKNNITFQIQDGSEDTKQQIKKCLDDDEKEDCDYNDDENSQQSKRVKEEEDEREKSEAERQDHLTQLIQLYEGTDNSNNTASETSGVRRNMENTDQDLQPKHSLKENQLKEIEDIKHRFFDLKHNLHKVAERTGETKQFKNLIAKMHKIQQLSNELQLANRKETFGNWMKRRSRYHKYRAANHRVAVDNAKRSGIQ